MTQEIPTQDLRETHKQDYYPPEETLLTPELDIRFLKSVSAQPYPWTFDDVSRTQQLKCKLGFHRGRIEVLGGEHCFFCSYCGNIKR